MRAGRQSRAHSAIMVSLLFAAYSVIGALSLSSSSFALLGAKSLLSSESEKPNLIKRVTSRVPAVSSLVDRTPKSTETPSPQTGAPSSQPTRSPSSSRQASSRPLAGEPEKASTANLQKKSQAASASAIPIPKQQLKDLNTLQFVSAPYYGGDGRLTSAAATQTVATFPVLEPTTEGWRVLGLAWYWWLALVAVVSGVALWRDKLLQFALFGRQKWQFLLSSKR